MVLAHGHVCFKRSSPSQRVNQGLFAKPIGPSQPSVQDRETSKGFFLRAACGATGIIKLYETFEDAAPKVNS